MDIIILLFSVYTCNKALSGSLYRGNTSKSWATKVRIII